ncbi:hypothetical protein [Flavobacterium phragmitis]|uniref:Uncharacterized protein n=1 Tax=Flavobacterium phragmitis TaxID=739143 RepID=A0A1I1X1X8_9FLAO|nr:hypothetical protein [Flavobacterium phragmitis]SFE01367.1 hypothetical protein SAMN05216297_11820 [Flavobacterium phragmitis]
MPYKTKQNYVSMCFKKNKPRIAPISTNFLIREIREFVAKKKIHRAMFFIKNEMPYKTKQNYVSMCFKKNKPRIAPISTNFLIREIREFVAKKKYTELCFLLKMKCLTRQSKTMFLCV